MLQFWRQDRVDHPCSSYVMTFSGAFGSLSAWKINIITYIICHPFSIASPQFEYQTVMICHEAIPMLRLWRVALGLVYKKSFRWKERPRFRVSGSFGQLCWFTPGGSTIVRFDTHMCANVSWQNPSLPPFFHVVLYPIPSGKLT